MSQTRFFSPLGELNQLVYTAVLVSNDFILPFNGLLEVFDGRLQYSRIGVDVDIADAVIVACDLNRLPVKKLIDGAAEEICNAFDCLSLGVCVLYDVKERCITRPVGIDEGEIINGLDTPAAK